MNIHELRKAKMVLEQRIREGLTKEMLTFERLTNVNVSGVSVCFVSTDTIGGTTTHVLSDVHVELDI